MFDATSGKQTAICNGHDGAIWAYTFSPDSSRLATVSEDRTARVWDAATGALLATCRGHASKVLGVAFSPDGSRLVTASADTTVRQWDAEDGPGGRTAYDRHSSEVVTAGTARTGSRSPRRARTVPSGCGGPGVGRTWRSCTATRAHVVEVAFAPDGRRLASVSSTTGFE